MLSEKNNKAVYINTAATTVVYSGKCILRRLIINTTAAGTITIYDNTSAAGMPLAIIAASAVVGQPFVYDVPMVSGITIVTAGASNLTVVYQEWDPKY